MSAQEAAEGASAVQAAAEPVAARWIAEEAAAAQSAQKQLWPTRLFMKLLLQRQPRWQLLPVRLLKNCDSGACSSGTQQLPTRLRKKLRRRQAQRQQLPTRQLQLPPGQVK